MDDKSFQLFQVRVEDTLAALVEMLGEFKQSMEERMDRLEEVVKRMRIEIAEDRARTSKIVAAIHKSGSELVKA